MTRTVAISPRLVDAVHSFADSRTPYVLTDLDIVRTNCRVFRSSFPRFKLFYAVKALFTDEIIRTIDSEVDGYDVASMGEIRRLLGLGINTSRLHFSNPVKSEESIAEAYLLGISTFTVQSTQELLKVAKHAPGSRIFVRVKLDDTRSLVPLSQKFGCDIKDVSSILRTAETKKLEIYGLAFHVGSQVLDADVWDKALKKINYLVDELSESGVEIRAINVGGGFPAKYFDDDTDISITASHVNKNIRHANSLDTAYMAEPGRYIVANSSVIVSSIIGTECRDGEDWLFLDTGLFQSFLGAVRYDVFPYIPISLRHWNGDKEASYKPYTLTGPTCDSEDIIAIDIMLPSDMKCRDVLIFPNTGAYTTVYGSEFNGFSLPTRHYINGKGM